MQHSTSIINMNQESPDLSKMQPLQQKRTLAFVNHFVMTNVQFMNNFMKNCEHKLMMFERKLEKVNAAMVLLEARLSSIPELDVPIPKPETKEAQPTNDSTIPVEESKLAEVTVESPDNPESKDSPPKARPEYERFVKMVQVGVPLQAVKLKVALEGLNPDILEEVLGK